MNYPPSLKLCEKYLKIRRQTINFTRKIKKWMTVYAVLLSCPVFEDSFKVFFNLK